MGGLHCEIPWKALVQFREMPTSPSDLRVLEAQLRHAYGVPSIYESIAAIPTLGTTVCATWAKGHLTDADLKVLFDAGELLYETT